MHNVTHVEGLLQIAITVSDLDRAVAFYRDAVGLPLLFQVPGQQPMAFLQCGGVRLMLTPPEPAPAGGGSGPSHSSILYFKVPDIQAAAADMRERGVAFERDPHMIAKMPDHELWMAFFRDPDKNVMALASEVR